MSAVPRCRHCDAPLTISVVDLGETPLANSYLPADAPPDADAAYELHARLCTSCNLVQVRDAVDPEAIFSDYAYFSSYSTSWLDHARAFAERSIERFGLGEEDLVVEIASNDGYLLKNYVAHGIDVLGVEPAANIAAVAEAEGVPTRSAFFGRALARELVEEGVTPALVVGINVFAHVPDINDFADGLAVLAGDAGVVVLEFPHLGELVAHTQFDTIYHEHFSYLSLHAAEQVLGRAGLSVFDVESLTTHGGSIRISASADAGRPATPAVTELREAEERAGLRSVEVYKEFAGRAEGIRRDLRAFLERTRQEGKVVAGYGAAAKGNTLLNYCGVTASDIALVADLNPHKQDLVLPGSRIPVTSPDALRELKPDVILILPWNLRDEIVEQLSDARDWGAVFVTAVPTLEVTP